MTTPRTTTDANEWVTARAGPRTFRVDLAARTHALVADEPEALGGTNAGPSPYELLLAALGSCTAITLRMYADRKKWPLERVEVRVRQARPHEPDCENCSTATVGVVHIEREIDFIGPLTDEQKRRLTEIADRCPVHQTLERGIPVEARP